MKHLPIAALKLRNRALPLLPSRRRPEQHAVPVHIDQALAIVIPDRGQLPRRPQPLTVPHKPLNVRHPHHKVRKHPRPVVHARRHPRLKTRCPERSNVPVKPIRMRVVLPRNRDRLILEALRHRLHQVRRVQGNIAPEQQLPVQRLRAPSQSSAENPGTPARDRAPLLPTSSAPRPGPPSHPHQYAETAPGKAPPTPRTSS